LTCLGQPLDEKASLAFWIYLVTIPANVFSKQGGFDEIYMLKDSNRRAGKNKFRIIKVVTVGWICSFLRNKGV
jgi:hypothetical protein